MGGNKGMLMEVEDVWNLGRMGILSCIRAGSGISDSVLMVVVVVVVLALVLVWMVLMVWGSGWGVNTGCGNSDGAGSIG